MSLIWKDMQASNKWRKGQQGLWAPSKGGWESGLLDSQHTKSSASDLQCNVDQIPLIPASVSPSVKWQTVEHYSCGYRFWSQTGFVQTLVSTFIYCVSSVQLLTCVWLFATPWTAAHQASLFITNSQSLLKLVSVESVMPSSLLILCRPLFPPSIFPSISLFKWVSSSHQVAKVSEFLLQQ